MPIDITDQTRRVQYAISGTGPYDVDFEILDETDIAVYRDSTLLALTTNYTVAINSDGTAAVTLVSGTGTTLTIIGARPYRRITDYSTGGDFTAATLNDELDSLQIQILQIREEQDRSFALSNVSTYSGSAIFPAPGAGYYLRWNSGGTALEAVAGDVNDSSFTQSGTGATERSVTAKLWESISVKDFGAVGNGVTNDSAAIAAALVAAAGKALYFPAGTYLYTAALAFPSNTLIYGDGAASVLQPKVSTADAATTTSKSNIYFKDLKFDSEGTYSSVITFDTCAGLYFDNVIYDGQSAASELGSIAFRFYGCINVTFRGGEIYDVDSGIYLDYNTAGAGATACDNVKVLGTYFEQTVNGTSDNPTGIYQFNCKHLLVDGCMFKNIRAYGSSPIAGYSVYEGDGVTTSLVVTNCVTVMIASKPHVMVQNSNAPHCIVKGNRFYAVGPNYPTGTYANWLYQGTPTRGSVNISDNFSDQAGIFVQGAGTTATATRSVIVHHNQLQNLTQSLGGAIRIGNVGTTYVYYAEVTHNSIYKSYSASIDISQCARAVVDDNYCANWNTGNNSTDTPPYSMAIYWEGAGANSSIGFCRRNRLENNTQVGADTGYPVDGIVVQNATNKVRISGNDISADVTNPYLRATPDDGSYTPTLSNTTNVAASTAYACQYARTGDTVTVSGLVDIDPTAAGPTSTQLGISLPFASNFTNSAQAAGTGVSISSTSETFVIYGDATNDRVVLDGLARDSANHSVWFSFTYRVL